MDSTFPRFQIGAVMGLALGMTILGVTTLIVRDFALQWQPVPKDIPSHDLLALVSGGLLIAMAAGLLLPVTRTAAAWVATAFFAVWVALHLPGLIKAPVEVASWLGCSEPLAMTLGAFILSGEKDDADDRTTVRIATTALGLAMIVFGLAHFVYAKFTADMVPAWLPQRLGLAYLTGAIHFGCGVLMLVGWQRRIAAAVEGAMMLSFVALVHIPGVVAAPHDRLQWTMLGVAIVLSSAVGVVATSRRL